MIQINTTGDTWVTLPEPALGGIAVTDEPVWASNTGRDANTGKMIGDIVEWKTTIEVSWPPLSYEDAKLIRDTIKAAAPKGKGFFDIKYTDVENGHKGNDNKLTISSMNTTQKTVYCSNIPRQLYSKVFRMYGEVKVTFIER